MTASVLSRAGDQLGEFLPRLGAALAVLLIGVLVVRFATRALERVLVAAGADRLAARLHVPELLGRLGLGPSFARTLASVLRVALLVAVVVVAASTLGLQSLDRALNEALLFLPRVLAALVVVLLGLAVGGLLRERVERLAFQMDLRGPLGPLAQGAATSVAVVVALGQLGVPTGILVVLAAIVAGGAVLTVALAFGLGSQPLATELSAGRYVTNGFAAGDDVTVDGLRGTIVRLDPASVVLETPEGRRFRLPNSALMQHAVELH